jgi:hypothetical protein
MAAANLGSKLPPFTQEANMRRIHMPLPIQLNLQRAIDGISLALEARVLSPLSWCQGTCGKSRTKEGFFHHRGTYLSLSTFKFNTEYESTT